MRTILGQITFVVFSLLRLPLFASGLILILPLARVLTWRRRTKGLRPRIVWGTFALPHTAYMAMADRLYGYDSRLLFWRTSYYNRSWEIPWHVWRLQKLYRVLVGPRYMGFLWSLLRFDVFQYHFDQHQLEDTILQDLELPLLKWAGKKIVISVYGSDVIVPGIRAYGGVDFYELVARDYPKIAMAAWRRRVRRNIELAARHAHCVLSVVPYLDVTPRCHVQRHFLAIDPMEWGVDGGKSSARVRIVHASNHRHNKGTDVIIQVCQDLQKAGYPIEFTLVEGAPRETAKRIYMQADIIVEQVLAGNIGMLGIEGMALGKTVVAYLREDILEHHPWMAECPVVNANPDTLRDRLAELIESPERRRELGQRGRLYVERYHSLRSIGALSDTIYRFLWRHEGQLVALPQVPVASP